MVTQTQRLVGLCLLTTALVSFTAAVKAATVTNLVDFEFNEGSGTKITDNISSLVGTPGNPGNPPTFITDSPSGLAGDTAVQFAAAQYFTVNDPSTRVQLDPNSPSFTLQAWVKCETPSSRQVFFYSNGKGGALSFSVNSDRTMFVTTLGRQDISSAAAIPDDGGWHHLAVTYDDPTQTLNFYVDGQVGDTQTYTAGVFIDRPTAQSFFSVGAEWNGALQYIGSLDRLKITSGVLTADQLDFKAVPSGGTSGLTFASPTASPLGFSLAVTQLGGSLADTNSITLTLNGNKVTPSSVTQSASATAINYVAPTPFASGSTNTVGLTIKDTKGNPYTDNANFVVVTYASLPASAVVTPDTTKKGFKIKTYQLDGPATDGNNAISTIAYNEDLLAGKLGPNTANTTDPVAGNVDSNGYFNWTGLINFDANTAASDGYFNTPDYPDTDFPGMPGNATTGGTYENFAEEILTALNFTTPGIYTMRVVTDWTGFPDAEDGFQLRAGPNPTNAASSVVLGFFDAAAPTGPNRGVADSPFQFYVPKAGAYPFRLMYYQTTGSAQLEWLLENSDGTRSLVNDKTNSVPAYYQWTAAAVPPTLSVARTATGLTLTFTGTIQAADAVIGPWADVTGSSPMNVSTTGTRKFYRAKQ
jgi:hypothetical protein